MNMNDDQVSKLIKSIDERFDKIDERFDKIDEKFDKVDDTFLKMFSYVADMDKRISDRFDGVEADIRSLLDMPDTIGKRLDDNDDEQAARDAQFARLVEWARKVSEKTGVTMPNL